MTAPSGSRPSVRSFRRPGFPSPPGAWSDRNWLRAKSDERSAWTLAPCSSSGAAALETRVVDSIPKPRAGLCHGPARFVPCRRRPGAPCRRARGRRTALDSANSGPSGPRAAWSGPPRRAGPPRAGQSIARRRPRPPVSTSGVSVTVIPLAGGKWSLTSNMIVSRTEKVAMIRTDAGRLGPIVASAEASPFGDVTNAVRRPRPRPAVRPRRRPRPPGNQPWRCIVVAASAASRPRAACA